jgi:hypothetical protein
MKFNLPRLLFKARYLRKNKCPFNLVIYIFPLSSRFRQSRFIVRYTLVKKYIYAGRYQFTKYIEMGKIKLARCVKFCLTRYWFIRRQDIDK